MYIIVQNFQRLYKSSTLGHVDCFFLEKEINDNVIHKNYRKYFNVVLYSNTLQYRKKIILISFLKSSAEFVHKYLSTERICVRSSNSKYVLSTGKDMCTIDYIFHLSLSHSWWNHTFILFSSTKFIRSIRNE